MTPLAVAIAIVMGPVALGAGSGVLLRLRFGRLSGVAWLLGLLVCPVIAAVTIDVRLPFLGLWDVILEGLLFGLGAACTGHRAFADFRSIVLLAASILGGLAVSEATAKMLIRPVPGLAGGRDRHFLLPDALRFDRTIDTHPADVVCSIAYGDRFHGLLRPEDRPLIQLPDRFMPRTDATRRVLHVGDSMVFGLGVERDETFVADLGRLEPAVEHINAGIPGTAPDQYLEVIRGWTAHIHPDLVVMYLFEGNDLRGLDAPHPCSNWEPLLAYDSSARLRWSEPPESAWGHAGFKWLRMISPPPYVARVLAPVSSLARGLGAVLIPEGGGIDEFEPIATQVAHLEAILATAGTELSARHIPFAVVILPDRSKLGRPDSERVMLPYLQTIAPAHGLRLLDAGAFLQVRAARGEPTFLGTDIHFDPAGHAALAEWLHRELAALH